MTATIAVVTGASGIGKTTICTRVVALGRATDLLVAGILSPPRMRSGSKVGIDVESIASGRRRPLASSDPVNTVQNGAASGPGIGQWRFRADALAWGNNVLAAATPCDILVIDEIGPLELTRGEGWTSALDVLRAGNFALAVAVVRSSLLTAFVERLPGAQIRILPVDPANRDLLPDEIVGSLRSVGR